MSKSIHTSAQRERAPRDFERGGATVKFLAVVIGIFLAAHAAFNYITVWYQCTHFKEAMNESVTQAYALPNSALSAPEAMRQKLRLVANQDDVPPNAIIRVDKQTAGTQAYAAFVREVSILPFDLYKYNYEFSHLAVPPGGFDAK